MKTILIFLMLITPVYAGMDFTKLGSSPITVREELDKVLTVIFVDRLNPNEPTIKKKLDDIKSRGSHDLKTDNLNKWLRIFTLIERNELEKAYAMLQSFNNVSSAGFSVIAERLERMMIMGGSGAELEALKKAGVRAIGKRPHLLQRWERVFKQIDDGILFGAGRTLDALQAEIDGFGAVVYGGSIPIK